MFKDFYLIKGLEATIQRRYVDAYHFLTTFLTEHPRSAEGNRVMGVAWAQLGNYDESLRHLLIALDE